MKITFWLKSLLLLSLTATFSPTTFSTEHTRPLIVGVVPQFDARVLHSNWLPILDEISRTTGIRFELSGSPSIPIFEKRFQAGEFDLVYLNPYHQVIANREQGYTPILRDSSKLLYGILVVKKDNGIKKVTQLDGQSIAFPAPNALGASLLMRAELANKFQIKINPVYVKTHTSAYLNTALGKTSAGGGVMRTFNSQPQELRDQLEILYETSKVPPHPISIHPRIDPQTITRIQNAFLKMGATEAGRKLLANIPIASIAVTSQAEYEPLSSIGLEQFYEK